MVAYYPHCSALGFLYLILEYDCSILAHGELPHSFKYAEYSFDVHLLIYLVILRRSHLRKICRRTFNNMNRCS